jgi:outer membrane autotransporter protein
VRYPSASDVQVAPGARLGGRVATGPVVWTPYVGAFWVDEPVVRNRLSYDSLTLRDDAQRGFARIDLGATAEAFHGVEGFIKGTLDTGAEAKGWTANLGVRWRW